jgi:hypothetical protein
MGLAIRDAAAAFFLVILESNQPKMAQLMIKVIISDFDFFCSPPNLVTDVHLLSN